MIYETVGSARETALQEGLRVWAEIDLDQLTANVQALKQRAGEAPLLVVVKANAYGHGAVTVSRTAIDAGAWGLGVAGLEEADELRRFGIQAPILVMSSTTPAQAAALVERDLRVTIGSLEMGRALSRAAADAGRSARVHVKVETGMNRFGVHPDEAVSIAQALRELPGLEVEGVSSHFATADDEDTAFSEQQYRAFCDCVASLPWVPMHHISNTAGLLGRPELRMGLVRCGLGAYGYYPAPHMGNEVHVRPILSLRSRVARVAVLQPGEGVAYGLTWRATRPSRVALVLAGYGDGLRLALTNKGVALLRGCRVPYVGRVMMDMLVLDVTDVPDVSEGDEVTLLGEQAGNSIGADEMASLAGTISYEVITGLMERVPRLYTKAGKIVARQDLTGLRWI